MCHINKDNCVKFSEQLWRYDGKSKKLKNRIGNWKYETKSDYQKRTSGSTGLKGYLTLQNDFKRFLTAEEVYASELQYEDEAQRTYFRKEKGK